MNWKRLKMSNQHDCKYNSTELQSWEGYCKLPKYFSDFGQRLVKCQGLPCEDFEEKEVEE